MKTRFIYLATLIAFAALSFVGCTEEMEGFEDSSSKCLNVEVNTAAINSTRALIESDKLPVVSSIGVTLTNEAGGNYDGKTYNNIEFYNNSSQEWTGKSNILLSATEGNVYAYYPYSKSVTDITAIPVETASQTDYMFASKATGVYDGKNNVALTMNHALSAIRFSLKKGTYTGTGNVTKVSVKSSAAATGATMNAKSGALSSFTGSNTIISVDKSITLSSTAQNADIIVVPTGTSNAITLTVTIDGKEYSVTTNALALTKGEIYKYDLTVNATSLTAEGVTVDAWGYNESGEAVIDLGHKVTIGGDLSKIALQNTVSGSTLTVKAVPVTYGEQVKQISTSGTATINESIDETSGIRTITVSELKSNVTLTFAGTSYLLKMEGDQSGMNISRSTASDGAITITATPTSSDNKVKEVTGSGSATMNQSLDENTGVRTITISGQTGTYTLIFNGVEAKSSWATAADGVWGVDANFKPVESSKATTDCIGAALVYTRNGTKHAMMIQKKMDVSTYYEWGGYGTEQPGITEATLVGGNSSSYSWGYLPTTLNGSSYNSSSNNLSGNPAEWTTGALSDFNGKNNTANLPTKVGTSTNNYTILYDYLNTFKSSGTDNCGKADWYVPACGQLAMMWLYKAELNSLLSKIGGTQFASNGYWSSSEYSSYYAWIVVFNDGLVSNYNKDNSYRVVFVRDLN